MSDSQQAYLRCEVTGGKFRNQISLQFLNYEAESVHGFFPLDKFNQESNLLEVQVLKKLEDRVRISLPDPEEGTVKLGPNHHRQCVKGGIHYVKKEDIVYQ